MTGLCRNSTRISKKANREITIITPFIVNHLYKKKAMSNTNSPLHVAIQNGNIEICKILLENQCDVHAVNSEGLTPLQLATQTGNAEMVTLLLKYGAGANPKIVPSTAFEPISQSIPLHDPFEGLGPESFSTNRVDPTSLKIIAFVYIGMIGGIPLMSLNANIHNIIPEVTTWLSYGAFVVLMLQFWKLIPRDIARTTPNKAAWFSLIPFFTLYWVFVCVRGLGKDMNRTLQQKGLAPAVNDSLQLSYCVCVIVQFVLIFLIVILEQQGLGRPGPLIIYIFVGLAFTKCMAIYNLYIASKPLTASLDPKE
ncbi:MAG: ankyrin repeat domain-containing protein [Thermoguttaceae bacterium]